jgi:ribosome biogenesis GTPase A
MQIRKIEKFLEKSHILIEVVDARLIDKTRIEKIEKRFSKKIIIVATKKDLVDNIDELEKKYPQIIFVNNKNKEGINKLKERILLVAEQKIKKYNPPIDVFVFGYPNVGKSSLINSLLNRAKTKTGFEAGITRGVQWLKFNPFVRVVDSPGVIDGIKNEFDLALSASVDAQKIKDPELVAIRIIKKFFEEKKEKILFDYFEIEPTANSQKILEQIAKKRGKIRKGGEPDITQSAIILIREWQKGKIKIKNRFNK